MYVYTICVYIDVKIVLQYFLMCPLQCLWTGARERTILMNEFR